MAVKSSILLLVTGMLMTGVANTLLTKYQDMQCVGNCDSPDPKARRHFEQPVIQTAQMFIGEMGCWLVVGFSLLYERYIAAAKSSGYQPVADGTDTDPSGRVEEPDGFNDAGDVTNSNNIVKSLVTGTEPNRIPLRGVKIALLAIPASCDIAGTTLMNVGLLFVAASIYQMTRGALVLFTGVLSVVFLRRHLAKYKWAGLFVVVAGVAIVGLAGAIAKDHKAVPGAGPSHPTDSWQHDLQTHIRRTVDSIRSADVDAVISSRKTPLALQTIIGVLLIAFAQIFTATQFVVEERIMERFSIGPLEMVGWEGIFGFSVTLVGMVILHFAIGQTSAGRYGYFDMKEGLRELVEYPAIGISSVLIMISIGSFNFFGLSVTRFLSATPRATIDTCRTLFIWLVSLGLGWETFKWLQVAGFVLLVYGTFIVNDVVAPPRSCMEKRKTDELLPEGPIEHM